MASAPGSTLGLPIGRDPNLARVAVLHQLERIGIRRFDGIERQTTPAGQICDGFDQDQLKNVRAAAVAMVDIGPATTT